MKPLVSIIIPCYNQERFLSEALDSVIIQTYENWECIIINDGSTDLTEKITQKYCEKDKRFRYIHQKNLGVITARNSGLKIAEGIYILPLDGDDKISPQYIEKAVSVLQQDKEIRVVYCKAAFFGDMEGEFKLQTYSFKQLLVRNMIFSCALHYKEDSENIGGYDLAMNKGLEDWDYWISILKNGGEAYQLPETLFFYRRQEGTRSQSYTGEEETEIRHLLYKKHQDIYIEHFGDPIDLIRAKENFGRDLRSIRRNIFYKLLRNLRLIK